MNRHSLMPAALAVLSAVLVAGQPASAQPPGKWGMEGARMERGGEDRLERLDKELNLTEDQKAQLKSIMEDQRKEMQALREDESRSREQRMEKMREIRQSTSSKIKGILDADQARKFEQMEKRRGEMRKKRGDQGRRGGFGSQERNL
ncbi:MAG: Spy/CpxP family protein refolding chaperone [Acidobacteriota bacterium]